MRKLQGYEKARVLTGESTQLPKGGYVIKIMDCKEISGDKNGTHYSYLNFSFDVAEGEYKGHYTNAYNSNINEDKKWKGIYNYFIPQEGSLYYNENLSRFKTAMVNFEESNEGFHWDWDEKTLKGKIVGIVYGEKEFKTKDGDVIVITEPKYFASVEQIRDGKYTIPKLKKLQNTSSQNISGFDAFTPAEDEKLPWE